MKLSILAGPADCGNIFGYYKKGLVPEGKFAIVTYGEYANGGSGPSSHDGKLYPTKEKAEEAIQKYQEETS